MTKQSLLFAITAVLAIAVHAECTNSAKKPSVPNGAQASTEEMLNTKGAINEYLEKTKQFLNCLSEEEKAGMEAGTETEESRKARLTLYNAAVEDMQGVAEAFNAEIKNYKNANPQPKSEKQAE